MAGGNKKQQVAARAYCSSANLGPGFDTLGLALDAFYDEVVITRRSGRAGRITISYQEPAETPNRRAVRGVQRKRPPTDPHANTAGLVARHMLEEGRITDDISIIIRKGVPAGLGLGSSAASAAAAAVACNKLFGLGYDTEKLVVAAGRGEEASAGVAHYDNVAASVAGGFVIARPDNTSVTLAAFEPVSHLRFCIAIPILKMPDKKTSVSRGVMPKKIPLGDCIQNISNASLLAVTLATGDARLLGRGITHDAIAEPARRHMIPGLDAIRHAALGAGAREVMISGAGPSVIAILAGPNKAGRTAGQADAADPRKVMAAMSAAFGEAGVRCKTITCRGARGAKVIRVPPPTAGR